MLRWFNPANGRHYDVELVRDLFGTLVLKVSNYGSHTRKGRIRTIPIEEAHLMGLLREIHKRRRAHGYVKTRTTPYPQRSIS